MAEILAKAEVSIRIGAPPERVFDAWLDPGLARQFLAAGETRVGEMEIDPREGGRFRIEMASGERRYMHHGEYVVIDRPRRLVFTWISAATEERLTIVDVHFTPDAGGTRVDLRHEGLLNPEREAQHRWGWQSILEKLERSFR